MHRFSAPCITQHFLATVTLLITTAWKLARLLSSYEALPEGILWLTWTIKAHPSVSLFSSFLATIPENNDLETFVAQSFLQIIKQTEF